MALKKMGLFAVPLLALSLMACQPATTSKDSQPPGSGSATPVVASENEQHAEQSLVAQAASQDAIQTSFVESSVLLLSLQGEGEAQQACLLKAYEKFMEPFYTEEPAQAKRNFTSLTPEAQLKMRLDVTKKLVGSGCIQDRPLKTDDPWNFVYAGKINPSKTVFDAVKQVLKEREYFVKQVAGETATTFAEAQQIFSRQNPATKLRVELALKKKFKSHVAN